MNTNYSFDTGGTTKSLEECLVQIKKHGGILKSKEVQGGFEFNVGAGKPEDGIKELRKATRAIGKALLNDLVRNAPVDSVEKHATRIKKLLSDVSKTQKDFESTVSTQFKKVFDAIDQERKIQQPPKHLNTEFTDFTEKQIALLKQLSNEISTTVDFNEVLDKFQQLAGEETIKHSAKFQELLNTYKTQMSNNEFAGTNRILGVVSNQMTAIGKKCAELNKINQKIEDIDQKLKKSGQSKGSKEALNAKRMELYKKQSELEQTLEEQISILNKDHIEPLIKKYGDKIRPFLENLFHRHLLDQNHMKEYIKNGLLNSTIQKIGLSDALLNFYIGTHIEDVNQNSKTLVKRLTNEGWSIPVVAISQLAQQTGVATYMKAIQKLKASTFQNSDRYTYSLGKPINTILINEGRAKNTKSITMTVTTPLLRVSVDRDPVTQRVNVQSEEILRGEQGFEITYNKEGEDTGVRITEFGHSLWNPETNEFIELGEPEPAPEAKEEMDFTVPHSSILEMTSDVKEYLERSYEALIASKAFKASMDSTRNLEGVEIEQLLTEQELVEAANLIGCEVSVLRYLFKRL